MALRFTNGVLEHVDFGSPVAFDELTAMSCLLLVKARALIAGTVLISKKQDGGATVGWRISMSGTSGAVGFNRRYASDATIYASTTDMLVVDTWRWVALTFDESGSAGAKVKMYACDFGGSLTETASYPTTTDAATAFAGDSAMNLRLGNYSTTPSTTITPSADIEYAVLYDAVLSSANLQSAIDGLEDSGTNGYTTNRVGEWEVGWGGGTTVVDQTAGGNDGTVTGTSNTAGVLEGGGGGGGTVPVFVHHLREQGIS
jgi:hypothetical protein